MQQVTVGPKYQIVIPKQLRTQIKGITPGSRVNVYSSGDTIIINTSGKDWVKKNYGALKKYWNNVDPIKEIEKMREEWDDKPETASK